MDQPAPTEGLRQTPERQFDFWLGDWVVRDAAGGVVGKNRITRVEQGAGLLEHWTNSKGKTGTSVSYYDDVQKLWVQVWMTGAKDATTARGKLEAGSMLLSSTDEAGRLVSRTRWTPLDDGRVRQNWEQSKDDGGSWSTVFDGYYSRVTKANQPVASAGPEDQSKAFDFLQGEWEMEWSRIGKEGEVLKSHRARSVVQRAAGGSALIDEWVDEGGFTVRTYSPASGKWSFFWTDDRNSRGRMQFWEGRFEDGVGTFVGGDSLPGAKGRISSKIVFADLSEDAFHWEMFLSNDGGKSFRLSDVREYRRIK